MAAAVHGFSGNHRNFLTFIRKNEFLTRILSSNQMFKSKNRFLTHMRNDLCRKKKESLCVDKVFSNLASTGHGSRPNCTNVGAKHGAQSVHPFTLVESYLQTVTKSIKEDLRAVDSELLDVSEYYFDGQGKLFRPMLVMLMAKAVNFHTNQMDRLLSSQEKIAVIAEMIHTASLMHDDVIDAADSRRGKPSINQVWGHRKSILGGDFVMAMASIALARIRDEEVVSVVAQITEDLVRGEFMQLGSKEKEDERFTHYLNKSFKKTASLLANSCKAVAILSHCDEGIEEIAYDYGKNVGISFQLIDDLLDFTSCDLVMGKPTAADLRLGLATAPVLFAAKKFPELNAMIMRRFSEKGDVETARELVAQSDGIEQTRQLAHEHSAEAVRQIRTLTESRYVTGLEMLANIVLSRNK